MNYVSLIEANTQYGAGFSWDEAWSFDPPFAVDSDSPDEILVLAYNEKTRRMAASAYPKKETEDSET